eukprot:3444482-Pyramimonas_sp.AAC.1
MNVASWGPHGSALGAVLGRPGGLLGSLDGVKTFWIDRLAIGDLLGPSRGPLGTLWTCLGAF